MKRHPTASVLVSVLVVAGLGLACPCSAGESQADNAIRITAVQLAQEAVNLGRDRMEDKYYGKSVEVAGQVDLVSGENV